MRLASLISTKLFLLTLCFFFLSSTPATCFPDVDKLLLPKSNQNIPTLFVLSKHHKYTAFLNIEMPPRLQKFITATPYRRNTLSLQMGLKVPNAVVAHLTKTNLPEPFENQGLHSSFLVNFWEQLTTLCIVICAAVIFNILDFAAQKSGWTLFKSVFRIFKILTKWNFLLILFSIDLDDIIYYSYLEFTSVRKDTFLDSFSFGLAILMFGMVWAYLIGNLFFVCKTKTQTPRIDPEAGEDKLEGSFQVLYTGLRTTNFGTRLFYFIYVLRYVASAMMGAYWYFGRSGQAIMQMFLGLFILMVIIKEKPFKRRINMIQVIVIEVLLLLTNIFTIIVVNSAVSDQVNSKACILLADLMIIGDVAINFLLILFLVIKLVLEAFYIYKLRQKSPNVSKTVWLQLLTLILQQGGFGFEEIYISEAFLMSSQNKVQPQPIKTTLAVEEKNPSIYSRELTRADTQPKKGVSIIIDSSALLKEISPKDRHLSTSSIRKNGWRNSTIQSPTTIHSPSLASSLLNLNELRPPNRTPELLTHHKNTRLTTVSEEKHILIDLNWEPRSTLTRFHDGELSSAKERITERLSKRHKPFANFDVEMETSEIESGPNSPTSPFRKAFKQINEETLRSPGGL